jgi:ethanolamine utilization protein EutQ
MSGIKHFKRAEAKFETFGDPPGQSGIARLVRPEFSKTMGVGLAAFRLRDRWTVLYDVIVVPQDCFFAPARRSSRAARISS